MVGVWWWFSGVFVVVCVCVVVVVVGVVSCLGLVVWAWWLLLWSWCECDWGGWECRGQCCWCVAIGCGFGYPGVCVFAVGVVVLLVWGLWLSVW